MALIVADVNPLMFVNWREVAAWANLLAWLAVIVTACYLLVSAAPSVSSRDSAAHVVVGR